LRHLVISGQSNAPAAIREAVAALSAGELVALPTETVYGLAADAQSGEAVAKIFQAKGRPRFNPLICHVTDIAMARRYGVLGAHAEKLAEKFWPGPLTLVVPLAADAPVHSLVTAGLKTIALRAPRGIARDVVAAFGRAVAAPSANLSGRLSPTRAEHVIEQLGEKAVLVLDTGPSAVGLESTILSLAGESPRLLRPGGIPVEDIEAALGEKIKRARAGDAVAAPGMLASHYAPMLPLRLNATSVEPEEALLTFGDARVNGGEKAKAASNLSARGDLLEAAANLFGHLDELDRSGAAGIAVVPIPEQGLGEAINDRLRRAATRR
jgi:L-threonylcarbamoyladenylate synthase